MHFSKGARGMMMFDWELGEKHPSSDHRCTMPTFSHKGRRKIALGTVSPEQVIIMFLKR